MRKSKIYDLNLQQVEFADSFCHCRLNFPYCLVHLETIPSNSPFRLWGVIIFPGGYIFATELTIRLINYFDIGEK